VKDIPSVKIINLYETPMDIDFYRKALSDAKAIIFQFPFYWASAPAKMKEWCDEILIQLAKTPTVQDKPLMIATTTGSEYESYRSGGRNGFTVDELLRPYQLTANHSGMKWQTPFVLYGVDTPDSKKNLQTGTEAYRKIIENFAKTAK